MRYNKFLHLVKIFILLFLVSRVTAVEDKLQEGVPWCIEQLRRAGMRVWVLTGDKQGGWVNELEEE